MKFNNKLGLILSIVIILIIIFIITYSCTCKKTNNYENFEMANIYPGDLTKAEYDRVSWSSEALQKAIDKKYKEKQELRKKQKNEKNKAKQAKK